MRERGERVRLAVLFFLHAQAAGMWGLAMSNVLRTHGLEKIGRASCRERVWR